MRKIKDNFKSFLSTSRATQLRVYDIATKQGDEDVY